MKKLVSLLLCLALLLSAVTSAGAMATTVMISSSSDGEEAIRSAAVVGDKIYTLNEKYLLSSRTPADATVTEVGQVNADEFASEQLFAWNGKLCALNQSPAKLSVLVDETGAFAPAPIEGAFDLSDLYSGTEDDVTTFALASLFTVGDFLYYAAQDYSQGLKILTGRVNLLTGAKTAFQTQNIVSLCPYEDGKLLAYIYDMSALYSSDMAAAQDALQNAGEFAVFDPEADAAGASFPVKGSSTFGGMAISGLCYGNGSAYYMNGSKIMGMDMTTGESRVSAYTGEGMFGASTTSQVFYAAGCYVSSAYNGLTIYPLDSENLKNGALRIYGEMGSDAHKSFLKNYPDIPVEVGEDYTTSLETITQAMVSDTNPYDVLLLSLNYMPVDRLLSKGYCADLSDDQNLWNIVNQMYPEFGQVLQKDGKLYGVPVEATAYTYGVNMDLWEELGLAREDLPTSLPQFLDFCANWAYDYAEDHPDIYLLNYGQSALMLFSVMLQDYMAYTQYKGKPMLFNTPEYRALLKGFESVDFAEIDNYLPKGTGYVGPDQALFSLYQAVLPMNLNYGGDQIEPLYMSLAEGEEPFLTAALNVMIINPKTTRMEQAKLYVENYLNNLPKDGAGMLLFPEHNDPVEVPDYQRSLDRIKTEIAAVEKRLETASPENRASLEDDKKNLEESYAEMEKNRYSITEENIRHYREDLYPMLFIQRQNLLYSAGNEALGEINTLMMQYIAKSLDADKMVTELDNRLRLMALEDN